VFILKKGGGWLGFGHGVLCGIGYSTYPQFNPHSTFSEEKEHEEKQVHVVCWHHYVAQHGYVGLPTHRHDR
jgi:hypothetical protein